MLRDSPQFSMRRVASARPRIVAVEPGGVRVLRSDAEVELEGLMATVGTLPLPRYVCPGDAAREARY